MERSKLTNGNMEFIKTFPAPPKVPKKNVIKKSKMRGRKQMTILESNEQIQGVYDNREYDFDRYNFVTRSPLATKEFSIVVNFLNGEITGDVIAYGSWYDIETVECIELLETLKPSEIKRDFKSIIEKQKK